jgi:hypothetical protein
MALKNGWPQLADMQCELPPKNDDVDLFQRVPGLEVIAYRDL